MQFQKWLKNHENVIDRQIDEYAREEIIQESNPNHPVRMKQQIAQQKAELKDSLTLKTLENDIERAVKVINDRIPNFVDPEIFRSIKEELHPYDIHLNLSA